MRSIPLYPCRYTSEFIALGTGKMLPAFQNIRKTTNTTGQPYLTPGIDIPGGWPYTVSTNGIPIYCFYILPLKWTPITGKPLGLWLPVLSTYSRHRPNRIHIRLGESCAFNSHIGTVLGKIPENLALSKWVVNAPVPVTFVLGVLCCQQPRPSAFP